MSGERILVVEDESIMAMLIKRKLENWGYNIVGLVDTGEDAVNKANETKPDLILMDIVIKGSIDGIETAKQIRKSLDIPIIYLTAYSNDEVLKRARETEPYGYLIKPFREGEVNVNIEMAVYKHNSEKKKQFELKNKVFTDFYELVQIFLKNCADQSDEEIQEMLLNIFYKRIENDIPSFDDQIAKLGLNYEFDKPEVIFDAYLAWMTDLLSSFGIMSEINFNEEGYYIEVLNCPWKKEATKNHIFCFNCQAILNYSLNWTDIEGKLDLNETIAEESPFCVFRLY